jgi:hypothetical protein
MPGNDPRVGAELQGVIDRAIAGDMPPASELVDCVDHMSSDEEANAFDYWVELIRRVESVDAFSPGEQSEGERPDA